jgi:hypothetical protein
MLSRKLFRWAHKIALFAIVFASLAPSISHALANQNGTQGFMQAICGVGGQKLYIQVVTTQGQSIQATLDTKPGSQPVSINHHLNHCPFCNAGVANVVIPSHNPAFELYLAQQLSEQRAIYDIPSVATIIQSAHLSRGPPVTSL